jgi:hypothetical protein
MHTPEEHKAIIAGSLGDLCNLICSATIHLWNSCGFVMSVVVTLKNYTFYIETYN